MKYGEETKGKKERGSKTRKLKEGIEGWEGIEMQCKDEKGRLGHVEEQRGSSGFPVWRYGGRRWRLDS